MNLKLLSWIKDDWLSTQGTVLKYDKLEHFILSFSGVFLAVCVLNLPLILSCALILITGFLWEIRDGLITKGQGFSIKDLIADIGGIVVACIAVSLY